VSPVLKTKKKAMKKIEELIDRYIDWRVERKLKRWIKDRRKVDYEFDRKHKILEL
jgi:hypothetical protein